jgi:hypothetical protein
MPFMRALLGIRVSRWSHFILLMMDPVQNLTFTTLTSPVHHASREIGRPMDPMSTSQFDFDTFRVEECNTKMPIVNRKTPKPNAGAQAVTFSLLRTMEHHLASTHVQFLPPGTLINRLSFAQQNKNKN